MDILISNWLPLAVLSVFFVVLTTLFAKQGVRTLRPRLVAAPRTGVLLLLAATLGGCANPLPYAQSRQHFDVIAFGSCAFQRVEQPIWRAVLDSHPDLFVFLGDNIYGDTQDMALLRAKYAELGAKPLYRRLVALTPVVATWDDHDYGVNDAGGDYPMKEDSKQVFLDFFGEPPDSERRLRDGGVYTSYVYGPPDRRVQVILLDTRYERSPLQRVGEAEYAQREKLNIGPYAPNTDPDARILGEDQWQWLETQLRQPAVLRLIGTSIPFLQEGTGWETWANFPVERARMMELIDRTGARGILFMTGDTHRAQFSRLDGAAPYRLWEVNSSGLTENWPHPAPDANRVGGVYTEDNYGLIRIDWNQADPVIRLEIRDLQNSVVLHNTVHLSELQ
jgi:alkaline phosphatase D